MKTFPHSLFAFLLFPAALAVAAAEPQPDAGQAPCGEVITIATHDSSTAKFSLSTPSQALQQKTPVTLVLLPGGAGFINLDDSGCPRLLTGNSLIRSIPIFNAAGFRTALIDAPRDYQQEDGLGGFRTADAHATDLGIVITALRKRNTGAVWLVGTSRGSISALNAASKLTGASAPDGVVVTSALMKGQPGAKKAWVEQSVFDLPLKNLRQPLLIVGHAADECIRSLPGMMAQLGAHTSNAPHQIITVTGGPGYTGPPGLKACEGRAPHGFVEQEQEVADGIARFIRNGNYQIP